MIPKILYANLQFCHNNKFSEKPKNFPRFTVLPCIQHNNRYIGKGMYNI